MSKMEEELSFEELKILRDLRTESVDQNKIQPVIIYVTKNRKTRTGQSYWILNLILYGLKIKVNDKIKLFISHPIVNRPSAEKTSCHIFSYYLFWCIC